MFKQSNFILPLGAASLLVVPLAAHAQKRPNIIHIMSDDHAYQTISAYGHPLSAQAPTPNIDRIAAEGMLFRNAMVENSLSTPSRACHMTGLYSHQNGQMRLHEGIDSTLTFVSELLQAGGYQTAMVGKWHMMCEPKGFDFYRILNGQGAYYNPVFKGQDTDGKYVRENGYVTDLITAHALEFLENRDEDKPFFLCVQHKAPHRNWMPDIDDIELYSDVTFPHPETYDDDFSGKGYAGRLHTISVERDIRMEGDLKYWDEGKKSTAPPVGPEGKKHWDEVYGRRNEQLRQAGLSGAELKDWKYQNYIREYLRVIHAVDESVGEILAYLEANGLMDDTVIVYTSDQGFFMGEHDLFDKRFMYEEALHTPFIIRYPSLVKPGTESDAMIQNIDSAPTYLDLAGLEKPDYMEGTSIVPVLKKNGKEPAGWRRSIYYHYYDYPGNPFVIRQDGVRDHRYKLIHFYGPEGSYEEMYDLKKDVTEMHNLIGSRRYRRIEARLRKELDDYRRNLGVTEF